MGYKLKGKIKREFAALRTRTFSYLTNDGNEDKNAKYLKKVCHKTKAEV